MPENTPAPDTASESLQEPTAVPGPDEFGRYRVLDLDTGAKRSVVASQLPHGNHEVLDEPASDLAGDALPVEYPAEDDPETAPEPVTPAAPSPAAPSAAPGAHVSLSTTTPRGQQADTEKEKADG